MVAEAFQIVDNGRKREANSNTGTQAESHREGGTTETKNNWQITHHLSKTKKKKGTTTMPI